MKRKTILCYGDSNTWGCDPRTQGCLDLDERWSGILQETLGDGYSVIEEGLCGRTTIFDDPDLAHRNGMEYLVPCLLTHEPLDLVILMLGTNDLKKRFNLRPGDIARGAEKLVRALIKSGTGPDMT